MAAVACAVAALASALLGFCCCGGSNAFVEISWVPCESHGPSLLCHGSHHLVRVDVMDIDQGSPYLLQCPKLVSLCDYDRGLCPAGTQYAQNSIIAHCQECPDLSQIPVEAGETDDFLQADGQHRSDVCSHSVTLPETFVSIPTVSKKHLE